MPLSVAACTLKSMSKVYRCSYKTVTDGGVELVSTFHYQTDLNSPDDDEPDITDIASAVKNHLHAGYKACIHSTYTIVALEAREEVQPGSGDVGAASVVTINEAGGFTSADKAIPVAACLVIRRRTAAAIRSGRGHLALPGSRYSGSMDTNGRWSASGAFWTAVTALAALLDDDLSVGTISPVTVHPVIYSRVRHAKGLDPFTFKITSATPQVQPHWLRSRMTAP